MCLLVYISYYYKIIWHEMFLGVLEISFWLIIAISKHICLIFEIATRCFHGVVSILIFHGVCPFTASFYSPVKLSRAIWNSTAFSRAIKSHGFHILLSTFPVKNFHGCFHWNITEHWYFTALSRPFHGFRFQ